MNDYPNIEERTWILLNGQVDGELSESEHQELDTLLADSEELRTVQAKLSELNGYLQQVPDKVPPVYLQNAITSTVRLPTDSAATTRKRGFSTWLTEHWLGPLFALTAGVLLTVGIYETNPDSLNANDASKMSGTIVRNGPAALGDLLDRAEVNDNNNSGFAELRKSGSSYLVDVRLNSDEATTFMLDYTDNGLEFVGVSSLKNEVEGVTVRQGQVIVEGKGEQHFTLKLRSPDDNLQASAAALKVGLSFNNGIPHQTELSTTEK